jgi:hypothetical protein
MSNTDGIRKAWRQSLVDSHLGHWFSTLSAAVFFCQTEDTVASLVCHDVRHASQDSPLETSAGP